MSKYKVGDKVVYEVKEIIRDGVYLLSGWKESEPLSTYTEPLEAKIKNLKKKLKKWVEKGVNQRAEITRLLEENKRLKAENGNSLWNIEQARAEGAESAWELARKIVRQPINGGYKQSEFKEIFDCGYISDIFEKYTYSEAAAKVEAWKKAKEGFKKGDVVVPRIGSAPEILVLCVMNGKMTGISIPNGGTFVERDASKYIKTGRHIDIDSFLKQIGEEE